MNKEAIKIVGSILYWILVIIIVAVLAVVILQRVSNNNLTIGGIRIFNVVTKSMVPVYDVGDILIAKSVDPKTLAIGDDIAYKGEVDSFAGKIITHRIKWVAHTPEGTKIITRGIAEDIINDDPEITQEQVYGKIIYKVRSLSLISKIINNVYGFYFIIFVPVTLLILLKIKDIVVSIKESKEEKEDNEEDDKKDERKSKSDESGK